MLVVSDGVEARVGALGTGCEWFKSWRTIAGERLADSHVPELPVIIEGGKLLRVEPGAAAPRAHGSSARATAERIAIDEPGAQAALR